MSEPLDTVTYTYEGDILTGYDGKAVSGYQWGTYIYDGWTYETVRGNRLVGMYKWDYDAGREIARTFTYDANGMRTQRVEPDGTTYKYVYNGSQLSQMTVGSNTLYFTYDSSGTPLTVTHNGTTYYYATNLQGDVVAILTSSGADIVTYKYDAWGNIRETSDITGLSLGTLNPLRYRGYVYDEETGWYYLQSRYYNPEWGRFLTADLPDVLTASPMSLTDKNLFAYCDNNPISRKDNTGRFWRDFWETLSKTVQENARYFGVAIGITQADSPVLGPADVAGAVVAVGGLLACLGISIIKETTKEQAFKTKRSKTYQYWEAYNVKNTVTVGRGLTLIEASIRVASGMNVMCANNGAAKTLVVFNGYLTAVGPEIHGDDGYYWHYHPNRHSHTHIWFY